MPLLMSGREEGKREPEKKKRRKRKSMRKRGLPQRLSGKEFACSTGVSGDTCWIPGSGRSLGGGNGNPLQYSCLKNLMDRRAWWVAKSWTRLVTERTLSEKEKRKKKDKDSCDCGRMTSEVLVALVTPWR